MKNISIAGGDTPRSGLTVPVEPVEEEVFELGVVIELLGIMDEYFMEVSTAAEEDAVSRYFAERAGRYAALSSVVTERLNTVRNRLLTLTEKAK